MISHWSRIGKNDGWRIFSSENSSSKNIQESYDAICFLYRSHNKVIIVQQLKQQVMLRMDRRLWMSEAVCWQKFKAQRCLVSAWLRWKAVHFRWFGNAWRENKNLLYFEGKKTINVKKELCRQMRKQDKLGYFTRSVIKHARYPWRFSDSYILANQWIMKPIKFYRDQFLT